MTQICLGIAQYMLLYKITQKDLSLQAVSWVHGNQDCYLCCRYVPF